MHTKQVFKICIDVLMTVCMLFLVSYSLVGDEAHEYIGVGIFILFVLHISLNRRWFCCIFKGRYSWIRAVQTLINLAIFACMLGSMLSGIVLSNYIFSQLQFNDLFEVANAIHIFCAFWGFILIGVHLGMNWSFVVSKISKTINTQGVLVKALKILVLAIAIYGIFAFYKRGVFDYLFLRTHFLNVDFNDTLVTYMFDYVSIMVLFGLIGFYLKRGMRS